MTSKKKIFIVLIVLMVLTVACNMPLEPITQQANENLTEVVVPTVIISTSTDKSIAPTATIIPILPTETPPAPTEIPSPTPIITADPNCTNDSDFIADVTIPDGTLLASGIEITKTWRILNSGDCTWTSTYEWVQIGGDVLLASQPRIPLTQNVAPGETIDISVVLSLSTAAIDGEEYKAQFQLHSPENIAFGTYPFALVLASSENSLCPITNIIYATFQSLDLGFCFLYPKSYIVTTSLDDPSIKGVYIYAPLPAGSVEDVVTTLDIRIESPAGDLTSLQFAEQKVEELKLPESRPSLTLVDLDGTDGYFTDEIPAMLRNRMIFAVHEDNTYHMIFTPMDDGFLDITAETGAFFELLLSTFSWIEP